MPALFAFALSFFLLENLTWSGVRMNAAKAIEQKRERKTEEQVLAEVRNVLEFARDFFKMRGRIILSTNIEAQLRYFNAAEVYQDMEDREELAAAVGKSN